MGKTERIGAVQLNYSFYTGSDNYSDGDIEDIILKLVKENKINDKLLLNTDSFPLFYHFYKGREFIVSAMDISNTESVLEIGAGCGAITGGLARKAKSVTCIELSERRAMINAYKNIDYDNIEIYVANYENFKTTKKYDVITLVGVFEYAKYYIHADNPYTDLLSDVYSKLNPGGRLYIAIENKLGIKYFAGCKEDHTGKRFDGIEGYTNDAKVRTFSYYEWVDMLKTCNIDKYRFMYPYPDYKFPEEIYSDEYLPSPNSEFMLASDYSSKRKVFFDESSFLRNLCQKEEFKLFSNSFLICITK